MTKAPPDSQDSHRAYLFDTVEQDKRDALEDSFLTDDAAYEALLAAESDLIDAYVDATLSDTERRHFERRLTEVPSWPARVAFAQTLKRAADTLATVATPSLPARLRGWFTGPGGFSRLVAVAVVAVVAVVGFRQLTGPEVVRTGALTLDPGVRGEHTVAPVILADIDTLSVTVRLDPNEAGAAFGVAILHGDSVAYSLPAVPRVKDTLTIVVPSEMLEPGQHTVRVSRRGRTLGYYEFSTR